MAGKKTAKRTSTKTSEPRTVKKVAESKNRGSAKAFFRGVISTPWRQMILLAVLLIIFFTLRDAIAQGFGNLVSLFGWGLLFIVAAIILLIVFILRRKYFALFRYFNKWLGGLSFVFAVWGIISFFNFGGTFGRDIIGFPSVEIVGIFRVIILVIIGILFIWPKQTFRGVGWFFTMLARQLKAPAKSRQPRRKEATEHPPMILSRPSVLEKAATLEEMHTNLVPPEATVTARSVTTPQMENLVNKKLAVPQSQKMEDDLKELRQVAQDVWKKFGQGTDVQVVDGWQLPPVDILDKLPDMEFSEADNIQRARLIEESLASYGVDAKVVQINSGPTVTQFGVEPGWDRKFKEFKEKDEDGNIHVIKKEVSKTRVKVDRITSLANDMSLALAAPSIRMEAPVPGKSIVGIEVPNVSSNMVSLRSVVENYSFQKMLTKSKLALALGKGAGGEAVSSDLAKMPHLLIAGATGSGKTVCLNTIISCLLLNNTPNDVRFIMVDPKRVELTPYNSIPHLATPVIVDTARALSALRWLAGEMDERYRKLASVGVRNIDGYNKDRTGIDRMPFLVLVIDELADLMMTGYDEVETIICRLAQLARAVGIHLIVATQRPSVDVITGLIKANFPTRISFAVTSQVDSRTILDSVGAEKLLGKGDMLFLPTDASKPKRLQGCFMSDAEMERLVFFWGGQRRDDVIPMKIDVSPAEPKNAPGGEYPKDPLLEQALQLADEHSNISTSFLQRRLHIGYPRAARLMEQLQEELSMGEDDTSFTQGGGAI